MVSAGPLAIIILIVEEIDAVIHGRPGLIQQTWEGLCNLWNGVTSWGSNTRDMIGSWFSKEKEQMYALQYDVVLLEFYTLVSVLLLQSYPKLPVSKHQVH